MVKPLARNGFDSNIPNSQSHPKVEKYKRTNISAINPIVNKILKKFCDEDNSKIKDLNLYNKTNVYDHKDMINNNIRLKNKLCLKNDQINSYFFKKRFMYIIKNNFY